MNRMEFSEGKDVIILLWTGQDTFPLTAKRHRDESSDLLLKFQIDIQMSDLKKLTNDSFKVEFPKDVLVPSQSG